MNGTNLYFLSRRYQIGSLLFEVVSDHLTPLAHAEIHYGSFFSRSPGTPRLRFRIHPRPSTMPLTQTLLYPPYEMDVRLTRGDEVDEIDVWPRVQLEPIHLYYQFIEPVLHQQMKRVGLYPTHAACLTKGNQAIILCGPDGSGKTSTALTLDDHGFRLLSDEDAFLESVNDGYRVHAGTDGISLTLEGAQRFFSPAQVRKARWVSRGIDWKLWKPFLPPRRGSSVLKSVVFLRRSDPMPSETIIRTISPVQAISEMLEGRTERCATQYCDSADMQYNFNWLSAMFRRVQPLEAILGRNLENLIYVFSRIFSEYET